MVLKVFRSEQESGEENDFKKSDFFLLKKVGFGVRHGGAAIVSEFRKLAGRDEYSSREWEESFLHFF